jgi:hypothetical protein
MIPERSGQPGLGPNEGIVESWDRTRSSQQNFALGVFEGLNPLNDFRDFKTSGCTEERRGSSEVHAIGFATMMFVEKCNYLRMKVGTETVEIWQRIPVSL